LFRRSPQREFAFGLLGVVWLGLAAGFGLRPVITLGVLVLLAVGYFALRLIQAVERLAAATEQLAKESDELSDSVSSWPWQWL
jgi:hypothetical protein